MKKIILMILATGLFLASCSEDKNCPDCGSILDGYIFKTITTDDLAQNEGLALLADVHAGVCVRTKLNGTEFDLESLEIVDDCCCEN